MCGIAGIWSQDPAMARDRVRAMTMAQAHRGPDDEGQIELPTGSGVLVLGHRRLSIQDLSPAGHQPMENPQTGDWIVFNGEIYNYPELRRELEGAGVTFRSHCDTEVILHAFARWGSDAFDRLQGMFALGLYQKSKQQLLLARDPLGIKPLYYAWGQGAFLFGSELRALEASGLIDRTIDRRAWAGLLAYGAVPAPLTMLKSVHVLEAGTWAALDLGGGVLSERGLRRTRFWDFPVPRPDIPAGPEAAEKLAALLKSAVQAHLISDVPVGVFLSSGLDSTAIAALCAEIRGGDVDTFSVALADNPEQNENPIAEQTARRIGARHHAIELTDREVLAEAQSWLASLDQPTVDGLNTYIISHAVRRHGIIVALSGLGGDEVFGGYLTFRDVPRLAQVARATRWIPRGVRRALTSALWRRGTRVQRRKAVDMAGAAGSLTSLYFRRRRLLNDAEMGALGFCPGELDLDDDFLPPESEPERVLFPADPVASVGVLESRFYMGNMLLRDTDVFSMAHALEIRVPLLDRRVIDLLFATPGARRLSRNGINKPLLVNSLGRRIPPEVHGLKKRGFVLAQARWMAGPLRELFEDHLQITRQSGLVEPAGVSAVWDDFLQDQAGPSWTRAWILGVLGAWLKRRGET